MSYASQTYASNTYNSDALLFGEVTPSIITRLGGDLVQVAGSFTIEQAYTATIAGVSAFSGVVGQGNTIYSTDGTTVQFVSPRLTLAQIGAGIPVIITEVGGSSVQGTITIVERYFGSINLDMRRLFAPWFEVGARRLELEAEER